MSEHVLSLECPKDHYDSDGGCLFWCIDDRYWKLRKEFIKQRGIKNIDIVQVAGGAKGFADEASGARGFLLEQLKISIRLHHTKAVILVLHMDCGAYGGSKAFENDHDVEFRHHQEELVKAWRFLKEELPEKDFPGLTVELYIADFNGLNRIMP